MVVGGDVRKAYYTRSSVQHLEDSTKKRDNKAMINARIKW